MGLPEATPAMCYYARRADIPMVAELLRMGGDLEMQGEKGETPLLVVCMNVLADTKAKVRGRG